ncbi:hypothetical protein EVAR_77191_1 [Eumeta japonica]|uniref:Uncharacterized protein n=1 Tax=Eumeta variegata TaxID=151549 RepID=A0A4C1T268_EUMVA|nr:hypothetical protein EVAR_77191_1 [Eumeta japonica]
MSHKARLASNGLITAARNAVADKLLTGGPAGRIGDLLQPQRSPIATRALSTASHGFELLLAMKHHARRLKLRDQFRDGRSSTAVYNKNIDPVRRTIITGMCSTMRFRHP